MPFSNKCSLINRRTAALFVVVSAVVFLCFATDAQNDLLRTWDDGSYIVDNQHIRGFSRESVLWAFQDTSFSAWIPLVWLSFSLDYAIWGLNPAGYHLTNDFLHAANAGLFFLLSLQLIRRYVFARPRNDGKPFILTENNAAYCALLAALFFALHPLRVESVAWAVERKDVLSLFFGLPAILAYVRHVCLAVEDSTRPEHAAFYFLRSPFYWLSIVFFCLSILSKPTLVTLPAVLLILDWFPLGRFHRGKPRDVLVEKLPFLLLAGGASSAFLFVYEKINMPLSESNVASRVLIAFRSISIYLRQTIWPGNLGPFYLHPQNIKTLSYDYLASILSFLVISVYAALNRKRHPLVLASWLVYLVTLVPVLGFVQIGNTAMADRFTYIPALSLSLLFALGISAAVIRASTPAAAAAIVAAAVLVLTINGALTVRQIAFWKDDVSLWSRAIDLRPHYSGRVYFQRGMAYAQRGEYQYALADVNEALAIATAKQIRQKDGIFRLRAAIRKHLGDYNGAIADYSAAIQLVSGAAQAMYYRERGDLYRDEGKFDLAREDYRAAERAASGE